MELNELKKKLKQKGIELQRPATQEELKHSKICEHLHPLETDLLINGYKINFRGEAWGGMREWVYFDCYLDKEAIIRHYQFPESVKFHQHCGTHDGQESGFICTDCRDGIMGVHSTHKKGYPVFIPEKTKNENT